MNKQDKKLYTEEELKIFLSTQRAQDNQAYEILKQKYDNLQKRYISVHKDSLNIFNNLKIANIKLEKSEDKVRVQETIINKLRGEEHG